MSSFSGALGTLWVEIGAKVDDALQAFDQIEKGIGETEKKFSGLQKAGEQMTSIGTSLTVGITAPLVGMGAAAVSFASSFESSMNKITAVSGTTGAELNQMREQALKLGADTKFSAQEAADGMGNLAAAGMKTTQIMAAMPGVLDLAAAGELSVARAAEVTTDTLSQFGLEASETGRIADVFAKAAAASSISVEQVAQSMKYVGPVAQSAGMSLEQAATAVALLGNAGIKSEQAGTSLRGMIASLVNPSKNAAEALAALGVTTTDAAGKMLPLDQIFQQLKTSGAKTADMFTIFGNEGASAASALTNVVGPAWASMTKEMNASQGAAKTMAETLNKGMKGSLDELKGSLETAAIQLGQVLLPALTDIVKAGTAFVNEWIMPAIKAFSEMDPWMQKAIIAFGVLLAAVGPALVIFGQLAQAFVAINTALPLLAGAWTALTGVVTSFAAAVGTSTLVMGGWIAAIGLAVGAIVVLTNAIMDNRKAQADLKKANEDGDKALRNLEKSLTAQGANISELKKKYDAGAISLTDYQKGLREVALELGKGKKVAEDTKKPLTELEKIQDKINKTVGDGAKVTEKAAESTRKWGEATARVTPQMEVLQGIEDKLNAEQQKLIAKTVDLTLKFDALKGKTTELLAPFEDLPDSLKIINAELTSMANDKAPKVIERMTETKGKTDALSAALETLGVRAAADYQKVADNAKLAYDAVLRSPQATQWEKDNALVKVIEAQRAAAVAAGEEIPKEYDEFLADLKKKLDDPHKGLPAQESSWSSFSKSVSTVITNFSQDIAKSLFDGEGSFGEKCTEMLKGLGKAVMSTFVEPAMAALTSLMQGVIADLIGGKGFGGIKDSIVDAGKVFKGIFGKGGEVEEGAKHTGDVLGGGSSAAGGGGAGGGAGSAIGSGLSGWISAVSGVVTAISSVIGNFQMAKMETTLNAIEHETRYSQIHLLHILEDGVNKYYPYLEQINGYLWDHFNDSFASLMSTTEEIRDIVKSLKFPIDWTMNFTDMNRQTLYEIRDALYDIRGYLETTRDNTGTMKDKLTGAQTWTVQFTGDPVASLVGQEIMRQLRLQGVNLV